MTKQLKRLQEVLKLCYVLMVVITIPAVLFRDLSTLSPTRMAALVVVMGMLWLIGFVVLPLMGWVRLSDKGQIPTQHLVYKGIDALVLGFGSFWVLRFYYGQFPQPIDAMFLWSWMIVFTLNLISNYFPKHFKPNSSRNYDNRKQ